MSEQIVIQIDDTRRMVVDEWENGHGGRLVRTAVQYRDKAGAWKLSQAGLLLEPGPAWELGAMAAFVHDGVTP